RRHTRFSRDWSSDVCSSDLRPARGERAFFLTGVLLTGDPSHRGSDGDLVPGAPLGDGVAVVADLADADADLVHVVLPEREVPDRSEERRVGKRGRCRWWRGL